MDSVSRPSSTNSTGHMFDRIASVYDRLNHILSFGMDFLWRRRLAGLIDKSNQLRILDLATGTGDLLITLVRNNPNVVEAVGLDISENMLAICKKKIKNHNLADRINLICADANAGSLSDNAFDIVTMGFGIRNTSDIEKTLSKIFRLLKHGGTSLILEFSMPQNRIIRFFYQFYLRYYVPLVGRILSGDKYAYRYLNTSIERFYTAKDFCCLMRQAGFENISTNHLTFGVANIFQGSKPKDSVL